MSNNNKYFLFYDNKEMRLKVYDLKLAEKENDEDSDQYQFHLLYALNHK